MMALIDRKTRKFIPRLSKLAVKFPFELTDILFQQEIMRGTNILKSKSKLQGQKLKEFLILIAEGDGFKLDETSLNQFLKLMPNEEQAIQIRQKIKKC